MATADEEWLDILGSGSLMKKVIAYLFICHFKDLIAYKPRLSRAEMAAKLDRRKATN